MNRRKAFRLFAAAFCVVLFALPFLSAVLSASHALHTCGKERCALCAAILLSQSLLRSLPQVLASAAAALIALLLGAASANRTARRRKAATLITQKVRINP